MQAFQWQIEYPLDAILFDCDSTLSAVEGITVLAKYNNVYPQVHALTEKAMAETGLNAGLYRARLDLVRPQQSQMMYVIDAYWQALTPDVDKVITCLHALGKAVYVVSAGITQAVVPFAERLGIAGKNVFAVNVSFDQQGHYQRFDKHSPLTTQCGKSQIVTELRKIHKHIAHVGDGMNDIEAAKAVDRFVGYGGSCYRESIAKLSPFYIRCLSLSPLLPLFLTRDEVTKLSPSAKTLYQRGLTYIQQDAVEFRQIVSSR
ncbi:MAG: hypothetical protein A3F10_05295 [Coxiella sp. RIFCSPHIGHO2_12_FULL_42_15]|nr:MAG: hypothetical protein A3F10_05295 [Coxiella sp. RIFCSPHIGHO2_12_FULL_42_15]